MEAQNEGRIEKTALEDLSERIGNVTISWNSCQEMLFMIFWRLTAMPHEAATGIFFTLKSDSTQRDITGALVKARLSDRPTLKKELLDNIEKLNKLAGERNAAIHTMWDNAGGLQNIVPSRMVTKHNGKLEKEEFLIQFLRLTIALDKIQICLIESFWEITELPPLPSIEPLQVVATHISRAEDSHPDRSPKPPSPLPPSPE